MTQSMMERTALRVGAPDVAGPLAVYPVFGPPPRTEYRSFAEARALGASVREVSPQPSVNDLVVDNPLPIPILLYEGELVRGAQQDRTFDVSVLVPPHTQLTAPVSCVEAARWDGARAGEAMVPGDEAAFPELRRAKSRAAHLKGGHRAEQGEVWQLLDSKAARHESRSSTGAMSDVFASRRAAVEELRASVPRQDGQIGAVAAIAGALVVVDVAGRADVFAALHAPLVAGYALDAAEHEAGDAAPLPVPTVQTFVDASLRAASTHRAGPGLGRLHRFADRRTQGARLELDGELVALTAFPVDVAPSRVRRPSARRRATE